MSDFKEYFTNPNYIGGYNAILSGNTNDRQKGMVYVEDDSDIWFWKKFIEQHLPNQYEYKPATKNTENASGKMALRQFYSGLNPKVLIARDADYDWLLPNGKDDLKNPFILHTFAYSKESVLIEKYSLNKFFDDIFHTVKHQVNIDEVFEKLSELVFFGLCTLVHDDMKAHLTDLKSFHQNYHLLDKPMILEKLTFNFTVFDTISDAISTNSNLSDKDFDNTKTYLYQHGINEENAYRFISGHLLSDLIAKIQKLLFNQLKMKEMSNITQKFKGKDIADRKKQLDQIFVTNFQLETFYRQYLINPQDEIHQKILTKIANLKTV